MIPSHPADHDSFTIHISSSIQIRIRPRADLSPKIVALVHAISEAKLCSSCRFYRHEPVPHNWGEGGFFGPPYALLQGSLADMAETPQPGGGFRVFREGAMRMINTLDKDGRRLHHGGLSLAVICNLGSLGCEGVTHDVLLID